MCVLLFSQNCFLCLWKDALYRSFPQKHPSELWNMSQVGYTPVSLALPPFRLASFCTSFFCICSFSIAPLLFGFSFFLPSLSPRKGLKNPLLQATQVEWRLFRPRCLLCKIGGGGCYWSAICTCVRSVGSTKAYLVLLKMVLQRHIQIKKNTCNTWTLLINWTARHHKAKRLTHVEIGRQTER